MGPWTLPGFRVGSRGSPLTGAIAGAATVRVLHVDSGRAWRGGQRQVLLLAAGLGERGHAAELVTPPRSPLAERARKAGIDVREIRIRNDVDVVAAIRLRRVVSEIHADAVHAHDAKSHAVSLLALAGTNVPLVVSRRVTIAVQASWKYRIGVARFIAISDSVRESLLAAGVASHRISVVPSGVPVPRNAQPFDWRSRCGWDAGAVICGMVGAMTNEKGVAELDTIAHQLIPEAASAIKLVLLGGDAAPHRAFIGPIEAYHAGFVHDIDDAVAGLDVLWHPSRSEGLGTVLLDAMALSIPLVAYAVGGVPEIVEHGRQGMLVPAGDTGEFALAASRLALDPILRRELAVAGSPRAAMFSAARMIEGTLKVYDEVIHRG